MLDLGVIYARYVLYWIINFSVFRPLIVHEALSRLEVVMFVERVQGIGDVLFSG